MADRLDNPIDKRRWFFRRSSGGGDGFGRFAEATARFMGSPRFVLYMTIFVIAWIGANLMLAGISADAAWDPYPFILLNLAISRARYSVSARLRSARRRSCSATTRSRASWRFCASIISGAEYEAWVENARFRRMKG